MENRLEELSSSGMSSAKKGIKTTVRGHFIIMTYATLNYILLSWAKLWLALIECLQSTWTNLRALFTCVISFNQWETFFLSTF